jgi:hypothetical protein
MGNRSRQISVRRLALIAGAFVVSGCGGSSKLEFCTNEAGNFRVLAAGKPGYSQQTLSSPAGPLSMNAMESVDGDQIKRVVVYTDLPGPTVQSNDPNALLDGGIQGMSGKAQWTVASQEPITLDGHPGREVRFAVNSPSASEKGSGGARIFLVGNRLYQAIMVGPASKVSEEELDHFVKSFELLKKVPVLASTAAPAPSPDAGSTVLAQTIQASPAPIAKPTPAPRPTVVAQAEPPSAPASDPTPVQEPEPAPAPVERPAPPRTTVRRPAPAPGRSEPRRRDRAADRPVQVGDDGPDFLKPATVAIEVSKTGGSLSVIPEPNGNQRERFREVAPARGVLVGFRVGYVEIMGGPKVAMVEPIYQVGNKYIPGKRYGKLMRPVQTVMAKPGYAVGAINTQTGLTVDAFQIEFMRYKDGQLDIDDSYLTNWLGDPRGGGPRDASSNGKLVVGIHGRTNGKEINGLGLLIAE